MVAVIILCYVLLAWIGLATALIVSWVVLIEIGEWLQRREMRALTREYKQWERARQATGGQR